MVLGFCFRPFFNDLIITVVDELFMKRYFLESYDITSLVSKNFISEVKYRSETLKHSLTESCSLNSEDSEFKTLTCDFHH